MNGGSLHESHESEARQNGHEEPDNGEDGNDQEVIVIQDTGFTVKVHVPGIEPFPLQVSISQTPFIVLRSMQLSPFFC